MDWRYIVIIAGVVIWVIFQTWLFSYHTRSRQREWMKRLHRKGYNWINTRDMGKLIIALRGNLHDIPLEDDISGHRLYKQGDVNSLITILTEDERRPGDENERYEYWGDIGATCLVIVFAGIILPVIVGSIYGSRFLGLMLLSVEIVIGIFILIWLSGQARALNKSLNVKGYQWVEEFDALFIYLRLGRKADNIPTRDEMATIPGYVDGNAARLVKTVKEHLQIRDSP